MRYLKTAAALALCVSMTGGLYAASTIQQRSSTNVTNSVNSSSTVNSSTSINSSTSNGARSSIVSNDGSTVSSSSDVGGTNSTVTNTIVGKNGSMCSAEIDGKRCDVTCRLPQVAQCGKRADDTRGPSCMCQ